MLGALAALLVALIVLGFLGLTYNRFVVRRNRVENAWSQVDVQLKLRHDLIPNLVETVKGYAAHERDLLTAVASAREQAMSVQGPALRAGAEATLEAAVNRLLATTEAYPQLKADQVFMRFQQELYDVEGKVAYARQFYNDAVFAFNRALQTFPANLAAVLLRFQPREFFEATGVDRAPVAGR
jgi:LemA protein